MKHKTKELIAFFFSYQKKYLSIAVGAGVLLLVNVLLQLPMPLVTRYLIDTIIPSKNFTALNLLCLALLAVIIFRQLSNYFMQYLLAMYKAKVHLDLEQSLYLHVQALPLDYYIRKSTGYILSRISEVSAIESALADTFIFILKDALTIIVGAILILSLHFELGLISLVLLPPFVYALKYFHVKIKDINKELREANATYYGKVERNITAIEKIKSAVKEETEGRRVSRRLSEVIQLNFKSELLNAIASTVTAFLGMAAPFIVLWYGVSSIMKGTLTLGTFFAINSFLGYLYKPAKSLTNTGYSLSRALAGLERVYELFRQQEEPCEGDPVHSIDSIEFRDVSFSYGGGKNVLKNLYFALKQGERIALVSASGQGKSTLVKMLMKFYVPDTGAIFVSGRNLNNISAKALREKIAYISQRPYLLEDDLEEKRKEPEVHKWLQHFRFEKSFESKEDNSNQSGNQLNQKEFSGGEVQKLELIDALLTDADVLIIDEGTSNIDFNAEKLLLNELFKKFQEKIIIFIAHRLTTVKDFERIVVLENGNVLEEGSHETLMTRKGKYYFLWGKVEKQDKSKIQPD